MYSRAECNVAKTMYENACPHRASVAPTEASKPIVVTRFGHIARGVLGRFSGEPTAPPKCLSAGESTDGQDDRA